jgi:hypothetical protein
MNNKIVILFTAAALAWGTAFCQETEKPSYEKQMEQLELYLAAAEIAAVDKETESGRTGGWDVILEKDGVRHKARFKQVNKHRPIFLADSFQYELAAYALNRMLSQTIVPPMVPRQIDGVSGSLQIFMENCIQQSDFVRGNQKPPDPVIFEQAKVVIEIFELLTADECHDMEDTLIQLDSWKICRIDFSEAFKPRPSLSSDCTISSCSRSLYRALKELAREDLTAKLSDYLNADELDGLWQRAGLIIRQLDDLIKTSGEDKILFDF